MSVRAGSMPPMTSTTMSAVAARLFASVVNSARSISGARGRPGRRTAIPISSRGVPMRAARSEPCKRSRRATSVPTAPHPRRATLSGCVRMLVRPFLPRVRHLRRYQGRKRGPTRAPLRRNQRITRRLSTPCHSHRQPRNAQGPHLDAATRAGAFVGRHVPFSGWCPQREGPLPVRDPAALMERGRYLTGHLNLAVSDRERGEPQHTVARYDEFVLPLHVRPPRTGIHVPQTVDLDHHSPLLEIRVEPAGEVARIAANGLPIWLGQPESAQ